tara:strand:+ start:722 stop:1303 length:582 start_codon:yes stop_codon:yes gene_type:complete
MDETADDWLDQLSIFDEEEDEAPDNRSSYQKYFYELDRLRERSNEPISRCSHCGANSKVYAYKLGSYARVLIWMAYNSEHEEYVHIPTSGAINGGGDYAKLRYWGLIEKSPTNPGSKKRSTGLWKLTELGRNFALNKATVNGVCYYSHPPGEVLGFEPDHISIVDALGRYFNYEELMSGYEWEAVLGPWYNNQ